MTATAAIASARRNWPALCWCACSGRWSSCVPVGGARGGSNWIAARLAPLAPLAGRGRQRAMATRGPICAKALTVPPIPALWLDQKSSPSSSSAGSSLLLNFSLPPSWRTRQVTYRIGCCCEVRGFPPWTAVFLPSYFCRFFRLLPFPLPSPRWPPCVSFSAPILSSPRLRIVASLSSLRLVVVPSFPAQLPAFCLAPVFLISSPTRAPRSRSVLSQLLLRSARQAVPAHWPFARPASTSPTSIPTGFLRQRNCAERRLIETKQSSTRFCSEAFRILSEREKNACWLIP